MTETAYRNRPDIDSVFVEWSDLCALVAEQGGLHGFTYWAFAVGTDGSVQERLVRGRIAWARWGTVWSTKEP